MNTDELYRDIILDHHKHPRGNTSLEAFNAASFGMNPSCGDEVEIKLNIQNDTVEGVQVISRGCAVSVASGSILAESAIGLKLSVLKDMALNVQKMLQTGQTETNFDPGDFEALMGVRRFPVRVKCAALSIAAIIKAIESFETGCKSQDVNLEESA